MIHRLTVVLLAFALAACAPLAPVQEDAPQFTQAEKDSMTTEEKAKIYNESVVDEDDKVICRRYTPTGSHRARTVCRTVKEAEIERQAAQETLRKGRGTALTPQD